MTIGLYVPGRSLLHRAPAGLKLLALALTLGLVVTLTRWPQLAVGGAALVGLVVLAGVPLRTFAAQLWPLRWIVVALLAFHLVVNSAAVAVGVVGRLLLAVGLAALVTLTTRTSALLETVTTLAGPLRRFGVSAQRLGLLVALAVRAVPVVVALAEEVREAQRARGLAADPRAYAVPLVVRALRHADAVGEALDARGLVD